MSDTMKYYVKHAGTLLAITLVVGLLLAVVNGITAPIIAAQGDSARGEALGVVMPEADNFKDVDYTADPVVLSMVEAYQGDTFLGWCVEVGANGYAGAINMIVGIDAAGEVSALQVVSHGETPGIGTNAVDNADWLAQFIGQSGAAAVDTVSSATRSSRGVIDGVNAALTAVGTIMQEGGDLGV